MVFESLYNAFEGKALDLSDLKTFRDFLKVDPSYIKPKEVTFLLNQVQKYSGCADVVVDDVRFKTMLIPPRRDRKRLYVSLTSGTRHAKDRFVRWQSSSLFDGYFLAIDDPMFQHFKIPNDLMGWFYGTSDNNFLIKTSLVIKHIAKVLAIPFSEITLIGSSSGAYAATYIAKYIDGCSVIAMSPQLVLHKWPYAKKLEDVTGLDFCALSDRNYLSKYNDLSKYIFAFNLSAKHYLPQLEYLLSQYNLKITDLKYGLNVLSSNILLWVYVVDDFYNPHLVHPQEYEIVYMDYILREYNNYKNLDGLSSFTVLISELMNQRYVIQNKLSSLNSIETNRSLDINQLYIDTMNLLELVDLHKKDTKYVATLEKILSEKFKQFPFDLSSFQSKIKANRKDRLENAFFIRNNIGILTNKLKDNLCVNSSSNKIYVFTYWHDINNIPECVKICRKSLQKFVDKEHFELVMLNSTNISDYITIPPYIDRNAMEMAHYADVLRMLLLAKYGGFWIDSTCFLTKDFYESTKELTNNDAFYFRFSTNIISSWFIYAKPDSVIIKYNLLVLLLWWEKQKRQTNYFMFHDLVEMQYPLIPEYRKIWDTMMFLPSQGPISFFFNVFRKDFNQQNFEKGLRNHFIHKLTYKYNDQSVKQKLEYLDNFLK